VNTSNNTSDPQQLVILSGKGGTGKTSTVAALSALISNKVLADCDVDAANLRLLLDSRVTSSESFRSGLEAHVVPNHCSSCGACMAHCRFSAIVCLVEEDTPPTYAVDHLACEGCGLCGEVCPSNAIEYQEPERGRLFISDTNHGPLVDAQLNIGGENSGRLVTLVRDRALALARERGAKLVVVDGPPGIGCPAIASTTGADLVLVVTEPTVSGKHDLERTADLIERLDVPLAVCINKRDLNQEMAAEIRALCSQRRIPVVGEMDYDTEVVRAQVAGENIVEHGGSSVAAQIQDMWTAIERMLQEMEASR
jgi:MinD superfamily P-loop ATPase